MKNLPALDNLLRLLQQVPYLASKNLYRVANFFLEADQAKITQFCAALQAIKAEIVACPLCFAWQQRAAACQYCDARQRQTKQICVVANWQDLLALERTQGYRGSYHVLGGLLCPLDGIGPSDLHLQPLLQRAASEVELIMALSQTPEGEATTAYIVDQLKNSSVKITCLARGMPVGSTLEYLDRVTLYKALTERRPF